MNKRSPWFNARTQPPVNGWLDDEYEQRCKAKRPPHSQDKPIDMAYRLWLTHDSCSHCQWRGLLREDGGKA